VFAGRIIADVVYVNFQQTIVLCTLQNGRVEWSFQKIRQYGENIETHGAKISAFVNSVKAVFSIEVPLESYLR
jgi:hypothetical protein